jgi:hypothetical protein
MGIQSLRVRNARVVVDVFRSGNDWRLAGRGGFPHAARPYRRLN